jgi:hypothetical protein
MAWLIAFLLSLEEDLEVVGYDDADDGCLGSA